MAASYVIQTFEDYSEAAQKLSEDMEKAYGPIPHGGKIFIATFQLHKDFEITAGQLFTDFCKRQTSQNPDNTKTGIPGIHFYFLLMDYHFSGDPQLFPKDYADPPFQNQIHIVYDTLPRGLGSKLPPLPLPWSLMPLPSSVACHHQKFVLLHADDACLWCSGWNLTNEYWDVPQHPSSGVPPMNLTQPLHDTAVRMTRLDVSRDNVIADFEAEFVRRWNDGGQANPAMCSNFVPLSSPIFFSPLAPAPYAVTPPARIVSDVRSLIQPELSQSRSPIEAWYKARVEEASYFVYLENQYLWDDDILDKLIANYLAHESTGAKLNAAINLCSSIIVGPHTPYADANMLSATRIRLSTAEELTLAPGMTHLTQYKLKRPTGGWTSVKNWQIHAGTNRYWTLQDGSTTHTFWEQDFRRASGGVLMWTMTTTDLTKRIYIHSKQGIIDSFFTIGSGNLDTLSFYLNSEANLVVNDVEAAYELATKSWLNILNGNRLAPSPFIPKNLKKLTAADYSIPVKTQIIKNAPLYTNLTQWYDALDLTARTNYRIFKASHAKLKSPVSLLIEFPYPG